MNFAVEKVNDSVIEKHIVEKKEKEVVTYTRGMVKTGDNSNVVIFSVITLISGIALLVIAVMEAKKNRRKKGA